MEQLAEKLKEQNLLPEKPLESFDSVELDEAEIEAALFQARREKHFRVERQKYDEKLRAPIEFPKYTAEDLSIQLKKTPINEEGELFRIDDDNREAVKLLCYYFTEDKRFESEGRLLKKGLLLFGGVGVGKSMLMHLLQRNQKQSYRLISCIDVVSEFTNQTKEDRNAGVNVLARFYGDFHAPLNGNNYGHKILGLCFDDLGVENTRAVYYGEVKNCMEEIIWQRYKTGDFTKTHVTTNLSAEELKSAYGVRVYDRMLEMFNLIAWPLNAKSRRG